MWLEWPPRNEGPGFASFFFFFFHSVLTQFKLTSFVKQRLIFNFEFNKHVVISLIFATLLSNIFLFFNKGARFLMSWWSVLVERISYCSLLQLYFLGGRGRLTLSSQGTQALKHSFPLLQLYVVNRRVRFSFAYCLRKTAAGCGTVHPVAK